MFTTTEKLQLQVSASYGAVLTFGDKVFVTDISYKGGFSATIYEFIETPEETGLCDCECRLTKWAEADKNFKDNGSAIEWCFAQLRK